MPAPHDACVTREPDRRPPERPTREAWAVMTAVPPAPIMPRVDGNGKRRLVRLRRTREEDGDLLMFLVGISVMLVWPALVF